MQVPSFEVVVTIIMIIIIIKVKFQEVEGP